MLRPDVVMPVFNRLVDDLERAIRETDGGTVTLAAGETETIVPSRVARATSTVVLTPSDAVAAANQDWYVEAEAGQIRITHGSNGSARTVSYFIT